jgi:SAM-dependent methyltransferase
LDVVPQSQKSDVPYVPTATPVVNKMLEMAEVGPDDRVYDLGSGDGRIVIQAAKRYGARGVGIEIDPELVEKARAKARAAGVSDLVEFRQADLFETDFSDATVVTMYLLPSVNKELRPQLFEQLAPGTPVVSHDFGMGAWEPEQTATLEGDLVYRWTIPEEVPAHLQEDAPEDGTP